MTRDVSPNKLEGGHASLSPQKGKSPKRAKTGQKGVTTDLSPVSTAGKFVHLNCLQGFVLVSIKGSGHHVPSHVQSTED